MLRNQSKIQDLDVIPESTVLEEASKSCGAACASFSSNSVTLLCVQLDAFSRQVFTKCSRLSGLRPRALHRFCGSGAQSSCLIGLPRWPSLVKISLVVSLCSILYPASTTFEICFKLGCQTSWWGAEWVKVCIAQAITSKSQPPQHSLRLILNHGFHDGLDVQRLEATSELSQWRLIVAIHKQFH